MTTRRKKFGLTFEEAMYFLRKGKAVRRASWHTQSKLIKHDNSVFIVLPLAITPKQDNGEHVALPCCWHPYSHDFFARDWRVV